MIAEEAFQSLAEASPLGSRGVSSRVGLLQRSRRFSQTERALHVHRPSSPSIDEGCSKRVGGKEENPLHVGRGNAEHDSV